MRRTIKFAAIAVCLAALPTFALARGHPAPTPETKAESTSVSVFVAGNLNKVDAVADTSWFTCNTADSTTFVDVPGMEVTFQAKKAGPVMLLFDAEVWGYDDCVLIRALINGQPVAGPGSATSLHLDGASSYDYAYNYSSHGFNFMTMAVPGTNTVKIQCATHSYYEYRDLYNRSLVVLHTK